MNTTALILLCAFIASALLGAMVIDLVLIVTYKRRLFDKPEVRKVHSAPVPRLGGVSFLPVLMITLAVTVGMMYHLGLTRFFEQEYYVLIQLAVLLGSGMLMYIVGIADDLVEVNYRLKLLFQFIASCIIVVSGLWIKNLCGLFGVHSLPGIIGMPLSVLLIMYIMNSINMIDGIDGLAAGLGILSLITLTVIAYAENHFLHMLIGVSMLGVVAVFWIFNLFGSRERSTKVFMGDSGSLTIGLILSFLIINASDFGEGNPSLNGYYMAIGFSTLIIPMLDVPRLVFLRLARHQSPFQPDRNHIHHLLLRCRLSQHASLAVLLGVDVALVLLTVLIGRKMSVTAVFCIDMLVWYAFTAVVSVLLKRKGRASLSAQPTETPGR